MEACGYTCIVPICSWNPWRYCQSNPGDPFAAHTIAELAAKIERCMVSSTIKATVNLDPDQLLNLYFCIFDNLAKYGFRKIIVYYGYDECVELETLPSYPSLYSRKPYTLYHVKSFPASGIECNDQNGAEPAIEEPVPPATNRKTAARKQWHPKKEAEYLASIIRKIKSQSNGV